MRKNYRAVRRTLIVTALAVFSEFGYAQDEHFGVSFSTLLTGSGYGICYNPNITLGKKTSTFSIGLNIQKDYLKVSGIQGYYQLMIIEPYYRGPKDGRGVYIFYNIIFNNSGHIDMLNEYTYKPDLTESDLLSERYSTVEQYHGFGMKTTIAPDLYINGNIGIGVYYTKGNDRYYQNRIIDYRRFREDLAIVLMLKVGIEYNFTKAL